MAGLDALLGSLTKEGSGSGGLNDLLGGLLGGATGGSGQDGGLGGLEAADVHPQVVPHEVNGLTPDGQLPADDDLDALVAKFGG
jgi:uncharacterized protein YidB (DUF937 family)